MSAQRFLVKRLSGFLFFAATFFMTSCGGAGGVASSSSAPWDTPQAPLSTTCRNAGGTAPDLLYVQSGTPPTAGAILTAYCVANDGALISQGTAYESSTDFGLIVGNASGSHIFGYSSGPSLLTLAVQSNAGKLQQTSALPLQLGMTQGMTQLNAAGTSCSC